MGISASFLIKHVRPSGIEAWASICHARGEGSLYQWLTDAGVCEDDIDYAFEHWGALALLDPRDRGNADALIGAAQIISQARWDELYSTSRSTIMFLNDPLLRQLSYESSRRPSQTFVFSPHEHIPASVTIFRNDQPPQLIYDADAVVVATDEQGNCVHFERLIEREQRFVANTNTEKDMQGSPILRCQDNQLSAESTRRLQLAASNAEAILRRANKQALKTQVHDFFGIYPTLKSDVEVSADTPDASDLNSLLNNMGKAPGASTTVTVPTQPASNDLSLVQNVQTLDSYIATLTALVMYHNHPEPYDLSDKKQAAQFVIDLANARNYVVTGGVVKAIPMYLPMGEASTQTFHKTTTSANLHIELLNALFGALSLPEGVLMELDGILTEIADSLKSLQLSFERQTQTLNHFVSFYHLVPVEGTKPAINQMQVEFIYLQIDQSSWKASVGKSSVDHFSFDMTMTRTKATMSAGIVGANTGQIVNSLMQLTQNDAASIANMTKMKGVKV